jgi:hypothetical protein
MHLNDTDRISRWVLLTNYLIRIDVTRSSRSLYH